MRLTTLIRHRPPPAGERPFRGRMSLLMPGPTRLSRCVALAALLTLAGCDVVALSFDGSRGLVVVLIEDGSGFPSGGYRVRVRQEGRSDRIAAIAAGSELRLAVAPDEPVELTLLLPAECRTTSPNPRTVQPDADATVQVSFALDCSST